MSLFKKKDDFCCSTFQGLYEEAGSGTGFGLLIGANSEGEPFILIQHRSADKNAEQIQLPVGTRLTLLTETGILFCPWCGRNLRRHYRKSAARLSRPEIETTEY